MKTKYKALVQFQGYQPGDTFEADLDPWLEQQFTKLRQIEPVKGDAKKLEKEGK